MKRKSEKAPVRAAPTAARAGAPRERWAVGAVVAAAFLLRVRNLGAMPVAGDESIYLRWAEIIVHQKQWFISLLDGKQPLSYWLYALARVAGPDDPLVGARGVSALAGTLAALGIFAVGRRLDSAAAGLWWRRSTRSSPTPCFYDRMAYAEGLVNLAGVAVVFSLTGLERTADAWKPGLALGLGFFIKSTAALFAFFPALIALRNGRAALPRLAVSYGVAAAFPVVSWLATPRAPMAPAHSVLVHQTSFFVSLEELLRDPVRRPDTGFAKPPISCCGKPGGGRSPCSQIRSGARRPTPSSPT